MSGFKMPRPNPSPGLQNVALAVLGVVAVALAMFAVQRGSSSSAGPAPDLGGTVIASAAPTEAPLPRVAFLGDSYTSGSREGGEGPNGYPVLLAKRMHWFDPLLYAVGGSGYVNPGTDKPFTDRVSKIIAAQPDMVIVYGSRNDALIPATTVQTTALAVLTQLHSALPKARIFVVGPAWLAGNPPPGDPASTISAVRAAAKAVGLPFIDPMAEGWYTDRSLFGPTGIHPNDAGHVRTAALLARDLERMGIKPATRS